MKKITKIVLVLYSLLFIATSFHYHAPVWKSTVSMEVEHENENRLFHISHECTLNHFRTYITGFFTVEYNFTGFTNYILLFDDSGSESYFYEIHLSSNPRAPPELV